MAIHKVVNDEGHIRSTFNGAEIHNLNLNEVGRTYILRYDRENIIMYGKLHKVRIRTDDKTYYKDAKYVEEWQWLAMNNSFACITEGGKTMQEAIEKAMNSKYCQVFEMSVRDLMNPYFEEALRPIMQSPTLTFPPKP